MPHKPHDRRYKRLFSDPVFLRQLLETCVNEPWVQNIDFSSVEVLPTEYIDKRLIASQNDMLYRISFKNQEIIQALQPLRAYIPSFRYLCIDEARFDPETLREKSNLISALFLVETTRRDGIKFELEKLADYIGRHLDVPEEKRAARRLLELFGAALHINFALDTQQDEEGQWDSIRTSFEVKTMLEKNVERWRNRERRIGEARGIEIGEEKGEARGIEIGEERGEARGKLEQKRKTALKLLAKGHDPSEVAEIVELPEEEVRKLLH